MSERKDVRREAADGVAAKQPVSPERTIGPERAARDKPAVAPKNEPRLQPIDPARPQPKAWSTHERTGE